MTNPTREEILDAFEALNSLTEFAILRSADWKEEGEMRKCCVRIIQALPEKPRPTMADIEWDDDEHFLAEAEHPAWGAVVMLYEFGEFISVMQTSDGPKVALSDTKETFTPTGRRYVLQEGE